jgi:hypothetical protein
VHFIATPIDTEGLTGLLVVRGYPGPQPDDTRAPFVAVATVPVYEGARADIHGMLTAAPMGRAARDGVRDALARQGVTMIRAERGGRWVQWALEDGWRLKLASE